MTLFMHFFLKTSTFVVIDTLKKYIDQIKGKDLLSCKLIDKILYN